MKRKDLKAKIPSFGDLVGLATGRSGDPNIPFDNDLGTFIPRQKTLAGYLGEAVYHMWDHYAFDLNDIMPGMTECTIPEEDAYKDFAMCFCELPHLKSGKKHPRGAAVKAEYDKFVAAHNKYQFKVAHDYLKIVSDLSKDLEEFYGSCSISDPYDKMVRGAIDILAKAEAKRIDLIDHADSYDDVASEFVNAAKAIFTKVAAMPAVDGRIGRDFAYAMNTVMGSITGGDIGSITRNCVSSLAEADLSLCCSATEGYLSVHGSTDILDLQALFGAAIRSLTKLHGDATTPAEATRSFRMLVIKYVNHGSRITKIMSRLLLKDLSHVFAGTSFMQFAPIVIDDISHVITTDPHNRDIYRPFLNNLNALAQTDRFVQFDSMYDSALEDATRKMLEKKIDAQVQRTMVTTHDSCNEFNDYSCELAALQNMIADYTIGLKDDREESK